MAVAQDSKHTRELPLLSRVATVVPGTLDEEARTVEVVWTTGARVRRGYFDPYYEELSLQPKHVRLKRLNNGAPLLNNHDSWDAGAVLGVVEAKSARLEKGRGVATVRFARAEDDPEADKIFRKVKDGILQNISVGYSTYTLEETDKRQDGIPIYLATDWEPFELSVVPMGADDGAGFRSDKPQQRRNPCVLVTRPAATVKGTRTMADTDTPTTTAPQDAPSAVTARATDETDHAIAKANQSLRAARMEEAQAKAADIQAAKEEALEHERARILAIRRIAKQHKFGDEWANHLIDAGATADRAREAALELLRQQDDAHAPTDGGHLRVLAGDDERDKFIRGASAWLLEHTGKRSLLEQAEKKAPGLVKVDFGSGNQFRGLSPFELARDTLERQGVRTRGMNRMELLGLAFVHRSAYQTTGDFPTILENVLHKILLGAYAVQETTWQMFCGTEDVSDFRPANRYRTGSLASLPLVAEHAEYTNGVIPDAAKFQISTERHGEIFSLSREVIINDDMGAIANLATEFGRAAARTIENGVYALIGANGGLGPTMADTQPFFHSNRANVNATGSQLKIDGLDADRVVMRAQKDPTGRDYLSLSPAVLLVPDSLYARARQINNAANDPDAKSPVPNPVMGLFRDIVGTPRLTGTRRYLFADPSQCAAFVVAFLQGYGRGPIMESRDGWRVDGVEWKVTQYAKAQVFDPKGAVTNAGTTG